MSAPAIKTWVTGELVSAADFNGQIKDQLANSFLHKATEVGSIPVSTGVRELEPLPPPSADKPHFLVSEGNSGAPIWSPHGLRYKELGTYTANGDTDLTTWSDYLWLYVYDNLTRSGHWILVSKITSDVNTSTRVVHTDLSGLYRYITIYQNQSVLAIDAKRHTVILRVTNNGYDNVAVTRSSDNRRTAIDTSVNITIYGLQ